MPGLAGILEDTGIAGFTCTIVAEKDGHALRHQVKGATGRETVDLIQPGYSSQSGRGATAGARDVIDADRSAGGSGRAIVFLLADHLQDGVEVGLRNLGPRKDATKCLLLPGSQSTGPRDDLAQQ
ncbi:hypothetical protein [Metapseudomonas boanensis]|uniref:Uncharacterized protein n=1 Tax=Metapseudomonas boanensis TaxID=2822138 RepID=A0ABS5XC17_9GAMM|nr:hypothetical protein [Pseudomonas boanensis]MBT8764798.1 hypothetical protein [Pseudomonas boanensis]